MSIAQETKDSIGLLVFGLCTSFVTLKNTTLRKLNLFSFSGVSHPLT
jgi:hypothetical protein